MSSDKNDLFDSLFDLNGDGKTTIDEEYMAFQIMNQCTKQKENNANNRCTSSLNYSSESITSTKSSHSISQNATIPETLSKENYPQRKSVQKTGIVAALITGFALSLIPMAVIWAVITGYDESNSAYWFVALLFGGGGVCLFGIIWHSAITSISECREKLNVLNENYQKLLSQEEIITLEKKKRNKQIVIWSIIGLIIAGIIAAAVIDSTIVSPAYSEAVLLVEDGSYEEAKEAFEVIEDKNYHDTSAFITLCEAHIDYDNGYISSAYYDMKDTHFKYLTTEQSEEINNFTALLKSEYDDYLEKKSQANAEAYRNRITYGVPYVGMSESEIKNTSLGAPSDNVRHNSEMINGERYTANLYDFKQGNKTVFTARCINGKVTEVWDKRNTSSDTSSSSKKTTKQDDDPYDVNDYADEEDFYYDHYDDFFDYEDAEAYYNEHHK